MCGTRSRPLLVLDLDVDHEPVRFGTSDLVVFDAGLSCTRDVHAPVRKHFGVG